MTKDNISNTDRMAAGIRKACEVIRPTYGPAGTNVVVGEKLYPYHRVTNDGKLIADAIFLEDEVEQMGVSVLREASDKAEKDSGDGRKTTMILTDAILREASSRSGGKVEVMRSVQEFLPKVMEHIESFRKDIDVEEVHTVAAIASESEDIGLVVRDAYREIGRDGVLELDSSGTFDTYYERKNGVKLRNARFVSAHMANDGDRAVYKRPNILITKQRIGTVNDINPIFSEIEKSSLSNEIVIYCDDIDASVLTALAFTHTQGIFKVLVIKAPTLWKDWTFEDLAKMTGASIIEPAAGLSLANAKLDHLGTCEKIITTKEDTTLLGIQDISEHIDLILKQGTDESKIRASWLSTKAAVLKVGGASETELGYRLKKAKDAICASKLALDSGVVPGAGFTIGCVKSDGTIGGDILSNALRDPAIQIVENMGNDIDEDNHPIDPLSVVKNAVRNAVSIASTVMTANAVLLLPKEEPKQASQNPYMM